MSESGAKVDVSRWSAPRSVEVMFRLLSLIGIPVTEYLIGDNYFSCYSTIYGGPFIGPDSRPGLEESWTL